jgi:putative endonuclease
MANKIPMPYYVYITTNKPRGVLYIGVTNNIIRQSYEHKTGEIDGFTKRYHLNKLVYVEIFERVDDAINREKKIKNWHRQWKLDKIESVNPEWADLTETIL